MKRNFLVVGLSALGENLVRALAARGQRIIAVDKIRERSDRFIPFENVISCTGDAKHGVALRDVLGREVIDEAVVAIGGDFLEAQLVAEALRELRTPRDEPQVLRITVVANRRHRQELLERLGYEVVRPVLIEAASLAVRMSVPSLHEFTVLEDDPDGRDYGIAEFLIEGNGSCDVAALEAKVPGARVLGLRRVPRGRVLPLEAEVFAGWRMIVAGGRSDLEAFGAALAEALPREQRA